MEVFIKVRPPSTHKNKDINDRNGGIWQSGISKSLAEYVQRPACFVNVQSSLHKNVVSSVCPRMDNAAYIIFIKLNHRLAAPDAKTNGYSQNLSRN